MPRFPDESVACLKRTMLARSPSFVFTAGDVEAIVSETGLNSAQVWVWAEKFRFHNETEKARKDFLESDGIGKANSVKMSRYFITCFNVTPDFATNFKFQKSKGQGEFGIKYMEAVFNKEAESGEFFIEFEDYVWEHKLIESFQSQGAGQVTTITFANNDGGDSAANALVRILQSQKKTQDVSRRGTCPPALLTKVKAKQVEAERQELLLSQEVKEKTEAVMKMTLEAQTAKLEGIDNNMQSQGVKIDSIENGVCNVIPDYQNEIKTLKEALAHKTKLCDRIEGQKGRLTMEINKLSWELSESLEQKEQLLADKTSLTKKIHELLEQQDMYKSIALLKQMQEETQHTAEILSSTLAEERAAKRPRV